MFLLQHSADIARNAAIGTNGRRGMSTVATGVRCLVLPMATRTAIENQFSLGKAYDVYFAEGTDVRVGDKLTKDDGRYIVRQVMPYKVAVVGHVRALCELEVD